VESTLAEHDRVITSIDWGKLTNRIVTCSQDRNAHVWTEAQDPQTGALVWKPTLVLLRINRAATFVRWSPNEDKFAVASGDRAIAVCSFDQENDWWVSKHLKKPIRSTVTTLAWHPNGVLLAAGSTDAHARVLSAYIKGVDEKPAPSVWGERLPFATECGDFLNPAAGWVRAVAFSPSGDVLAFAAHDSSLTVVYPAGVDLPPKAILQVSTQLLPLTGLVWNGEDEIIAAGYDCEPYRFRGHESGWQIAGSLETGKPGGSGAAGDGGAREESALRMFKQMDLKGAGARADDTRLKTVHQNSVSTVRAYESGTGGRLAKLSTSGVDGRVVIWNA